MNVPRPALELRPPLAEHRQSALNLGVPDRHVPGPARAVPRFGLLPGSIPGFRDSPIRKRGADGEWRAVQVSSGLAERMERAAGIRRGPCSDLTRAMHRRRWREPLARLPHRAQIEGAASKYRLPVKVVVDMARRIARDIPPSDSRAGKREIQRARGLMSGAARRKGCYLRDRESVALLDQPGATARSVAAHLGVKVGVVVTARDRLARTLRVDERLWRDGRAAERRAVKVWYRKHYHGCTDAGCACRDYQARVKSHDGQPWRFPRTARRQSTPSTRADPAFDRRTLPPTGETTSCGSSAGAAGLHEQPAPELQPGEGYRRLMAMRERLRRERRGRWRGPG